MRPATLRLASPIIVIADAAVILCGLLLLLMPADMLGAGFETFTGSSWDVLRTVTQAVVEAAREGLVIGAL